jgi:hypothetical protein
MHPNGDQIRSHFSRNREYLVDDTAGFRLCFDLDPSWRVLRELCAEALESSGDRIAHPDTASSMLGRREIMGRRHVNQHQRSAVAHYEKRHLRGLNACDAEIDRGNTALWERHERRRY